MRRWSRREARAAEPDEPGRQLLERAVALRTTTAREIMTPRVDVVALGLPVELDDVARAVKQSGHSRFPVYDSDLDRLAGILFVKDLFRMGLDPPPTAADIQRRLRRPFQVPEGRPLGDLLAEMRARRAAFAVVVDEYGGVEGVLTVKDIVSELIGELPDEFDRPEPEAITRVDAHRWLVEGSTPIDRVAEETGAPVPAGEYVTLGGFLFDRFGRIPEEGEEVASGGWRYRVAEMDRRRIAKVVVGAPSGNLPAGNNGL